MLTSNEIERFSMAFDGQMRTLENAVMEDIVRRIRINGEITRSADWQINRLYSAGVSKREIKKLIAENLHISKAEINHLYKDVIRKGYAHDNALYRYKGNAALSLENNPYMTRLIESVAEQTYTAMSNISQTLGFAVRNGAGKLEFTPLADYCQRVVDGAILGIEGGFFDYNTVIKRVISEMTNSGLRTVDYATGWSNRVDVAARRAVMTGYNQLVAKTNEHNAEQLGTEYFEVTWHSGARPSHQEWQGRVFSKAELVSKCGLGTVEGLCGANCYHNYYPFIPGVSQRTYTDEQLEQMNAEENQKREYLGREYTKYEALQRQRQLETRMRAQRQQIKLLQDGGANEDDIINARCRYRGTSQEYTHFSRAMDLPQQRQRVTADGLGNIGAGKFTGGSGKESPMNVPKVGATRRGKVSAVERKELLKNSGKVLTNGDGSGIMDEREFTPAANISEANEFAKSVLGIPNVSYKGVDITTANEWNRGLFDTFNRFPELKSRFGFVGECHERNSALKPIVRQYYTDIYVKKFPSVELKTLQPYIDKSVNSQMRKLSIKRGTLAQSFAPLTNEYAPFAGITVNGDIGKNSSAFVDSLKKDVLSKFHPEGCDTIRSVLDHEIGHQLDDLLGIRDLQSIQDLYNKRTIREITDGLSEYAWHNNSKDKFAEMIAEGWAEYCNNPNPREMAKQIGETIEAEYKKRFGK